MNQRQQEADAWRHYVGGFAALDYVAHIFNYCLPNKPVAVEDNAVFMQSFGFHTESNSTLITLYS